MLNPKPGDGATVLALPRGKVGITERPALGWTSCDAASTTVPGHAAPHADAGGIVPPPRWSGLSPAATRRRVFTAAEKARIVAESFDGGQSVCSVARGHGLTASQLFAWRKNARVRREQELLEARGANMSAVQPANAPGGSPPPSPGPDSPIEIAIGTAVVRVQKGADAATLKEVLRALSESL